MRASDAKYHSPFSYAAIQAGYVYLGGKVGQLHCIEPLACNGGAGSIMSCSIIACLSAA